MSWSSPSWAPLGAILGRLWRLLDRLGALLGRLGALLAGASWWSEFSSLLGVLGGRLGASSGPLGKPLWEHRSGCRRVASDSVPGAFWKASGAFGSYCHRARVVGQRLLGYLLGSLGMLLGCLLEPVLKPLGASWELLGGLLGPLLGL